MDVYLEDARVRVSWTTTDETLDPPEFADPITMTVRYGRTGRDPTVKHWPDDTEIIHDSLGHFHAFVDCPDAGMWALNAHPTNGLIGSGEVRWVIRPSALA